ncbi:chemotaxis protein CheC [Thermocaproicibacter melissae]|uniref:chemotaxis protein CheC n=1 Tax=Thermocaproicibacter melissae TaxID=2966552 RepID=UPI0024B099A3|nr:chemotaxis protein CheC [Thermocaproicibacter melissae]WBY64336.1 chemotaxis protein CheC [Thermocaproicibacter melissae]
MSIKDFSQLNDMHIDVLREIGNIGAGNAATSLANMLNRQIEMRTPVVRIMDIQDVDKAMGGPETPVVAILVELFGDIHGIMMFVAGQKFTKTMLGSLLGCEDADCMHLTEMQSSALSEIGNIMIGSYVSAISSLANLKINMSVPGVTADMVGSLLTVPAAEMGADADKIIFVEDDFENEQDVITANMMLIPSLDSLSTLMNGLGIAL